jgi:hypothetical protein
MHRPMSPCGYGLVGLVVEPAPASAGDLGLQRRARREGGLGACVCEFRKRVLYPLSYQDVRGHVPRSDGLVQAERWRLDTEYLFSL